MKLDIQDFAFNQLVHIGKVVFDEVYQIPRNYMAPILVEAMDIANWLIDSERVNLVDPLSPDDEAKAEKLEASYRKVEGHMEDFEDGNALMKIVTLEHYQCLVAYLAWGKLELAKDEYTPAELDKGW